MTTLVSLLFIYMIPIDCKITNFSLYLLFINSTVECTFQNSDNTLPALWTLLPCCFLHVTKPCMKVLIFWPTLCTLGTTKFKVPTLQHLTCLAKVWQPVKWIHPYISYQLRGTCTLMIKLYFIVESYTMLTPSPYTATSKQELPVIWGLLKVL